MSNTPLSPWWLLVIVGAVIAGGFIDGSVGREEIPWQTVIEVFAGVGLGVAGGIWGWSIYNYVRSRND